MSRRRLFVLTAGLLAITSTGGSTCAIAGWPAGSIGVFFDPVGETNTLRDVDPGETFDFWVLAIDPPGGLEAFEFSVALPPQIVVAGGRELCSGCTDFVTGDNMFVSSTPACFPTSGTWMLVRYHSCMSFGPILDAAICLEGMVPSSVPSGEPAYLVCRPGEDIRVLERAYEGCAMVNPTTVATAGADWGALKALYRD